MNPPDDACDLCGLPLRHQSYQAVTLPSTGSSYRFCCNGCKQVFQMLAAASGSEDPVRFKESDLFLRCKKMGIIPKSEDDLKNRIQKRASPVDESRAVESEAGLDLTLKISGMWCPACAWVIEETLKKSPGILSAACNFSTDRLRCRYNPVDTSPNSIADTLRKLGYGPVAAEEIEDVARNKKELIRFGISAFLTMNIMMLSFSLYSGFFTSLAKAAVYKLSWPMFVMAGIVLFYSGRHIFLRAKVGFTSVAFSMETLIGAGSLSAYLFSAYHLFIGSIHLYFDTASMLITLTLLGKLLEKRAKDRVQSDLESFFALTPTKVKICTPAHPEGRYVSAEQLKPEDIFRVETGEIVPADGLIVEGTGIVDESSLTGESTPIKKTSGDRLKSGTTVSGGWFNIKAEGVGEESTLGQMIRIIEQALDTKTPLEGRTDRILQWFVPTIFGLSVITGIAWLMVTRSPEIGMVRAVTVMVISCPCALGIAIPLTRVAGISVAGKQGLLVRNFISFETSEKVDAVVFDKTGTITHGKWSLKNIHRFDDHSEDEIMSLAAELEKDSDHYIAAEIKRQAVNRGIQPQDGSRLKNIIRHENGISARMENQSIKIGSRSFIADEIITSHITDTDLSDADASAVFMSIDNKLSAAFIFGDRIRENARETIAYLNSEGLFTALISGDGKDTTKRIGAGVGLNPAIGDRLPQDKANYIKELQGQGRFVAMVGDGINDAPAMAQAELAVAVHSGSHLGKAVADLALMRSDPGQIIDFMKLARQVNRKVRQNLFCAFIYNVISIPVAMMGLLSPLIAVSAMFMSSFTVIGNTFLLIKKTRD